MSSEKDKSINFGRKHVGWTNGSKPRPNCKIVGCDNPSQANSKLCPTHYREAENKRRKKLRDIEAGEMVAFTPLRGRGDLIVVFYDDGMVDKAVLYKPARVLSSFEIKTIYGESPRKARMDDGTLILTAVDARRGKK